MRKYAYGISVGSLVGGEFVHVALDLYICFFGNENPVHLVISKAQYSYAEVPRCCIFLVPKNGGFPFHLTTLWLPSPSTTRHTSFISTTVLLGQTN